MADIDNGYGEKMPDKVEVELGIAADRYMKSVWYTSPMKNGVWVKPVPTNDKSLQTVDQANQSFICLDCGRWGGPAANSNTTHRDFGIVWGMHVALCRFVPGGNGSRPANYIIEQKTGARADNQINDLIDAFRGENSSYIVKSQWSSTSVPAVDFETIYVILPDMHLPVVTDSPPNKTWYVPGGEINGPYDGGKSMGRYACHDYTDAGGNKYAPEHMTDIRTWSDRYLAGDIFGKANQSAARDLITFVNVLQNCPQNSHICFVQVGDMYDLWIGLEKFFTPTPQKVVLTDRTFDVPDGTKSVVKAQEFISYWVDRTNQAFPDLMAALKSLTVGKGKKWLWGNHDDYLSSDGGFTPPGLPARQRDIRGSGIYIEHGQRGDDMNCDGVAPHLWRYSPIAWIGMPFVGDTTFLVDGPKLTNYCFQYPGMRSWDSDPRREMQLTAACFSYVQMPDFGVYVMGHTHVPYLTKVSLHITASLAQDYIHFR